MSSRTIRDSRLLGIAQKVSLLVALSLVIGCGSSGPETASVTGKVTYQGKLVTEGTIVFYPSKGRMASSPIASDGTYQLTTTEKGDGAVLGTHQVTITARRVTGGQVEPKSFAEEIEMATDKSASRGEAIKVTWLVPEKYSQRRSSLLTREVQAGENVIDFELLN